MLERRNLLCLSTAHVSPETAKLLNERTLEEWALWPAGPYGDAGWFFWAATENSGEPGYPDDLFAVMTFAREHGFDNILFDRDADPIDELPTWEW